ncbi:hypothetical protein ECB98_21570 [Brucellaceae bacterium VT-16-1752]|nr:hypothetical protein ECB98_21570 [Brucellaceae bacterium VT-16-1752]
MAAISGPDRHRFGAVLLRAATLPGIPAIERWEPLYPFVLTHYPAHRSGIRNQSIEPISPRRRCALWLEML